MPENPSRTLAAILFTDIAAFTALMQRDEGEALRMRERHRKALGEVHERFGGRLVKHLGDGSLSVFSSAVAAVRGALALQQQMRGAEPVVPLRIGIHLGDVVEDSGDVVGDGVNVAARIEALAVAGSILLSETVYRQVRNQPEFSFRELGAFPLKHVEEELRLFALDNTGLVVPTPQQLEEKIPSIGQARHDNLPKTLTSFLGREREVAEIRALLEEARMVTLTGPGGTGKTRLSLRAAEGLRPAFHDGICWVNLAPVSDPRQVPFALVQALDINQDASREIEAILLQYLQQQNLLLVLDNFEQILEAAPLVEQILRQCPQVKILVTSRVPLGVPGEQEYPVDPLPLPAPDQPFSFEELEAIPSVTLFVQRAQSVNPRFQLNAGNAEAVAQLCIRLDGLPLAIELAAARSKAFPPKILLKRLAGSLDLLKGSYPGLPPRHQTLRQTIAWSYDLLSPEEKKLFQRLSVFSGGSTLESIEEVCGTNGLAGWDVMEGVLALVNKSLVRLEEKEDEPRYFMLETIREYAGEELAHSTDQARLQEAHAIFYLKLVERAAPYLTGPEQRYWMRLLEQDYTNIQAALSWCAAKGKVAWAYRYCIALLRFWLNRNLLLEGRQTMENLLPQPLAGQDKPLRLKLLAGLGAIYMNITAINKAIPLFEELIEDWKEQGMPEEVAANQNNLGWVLMFAGDGERAEQMTMEALHYHQRAGNLRGQCLSFTNLGGIYAFIHGRPKEGIDYFKRSLDLREKLGDERGIGFIKVLLGQAHNYAGDYVKASRFFEEAGVINRARKDNYMINFGLIGEGEMAINQGDIPAVAAILKDAEKYQVAIGSPHWSTAYLGYFRAFCLAEKDISGADHLVEEGIRLTGRYAIVTVQIVGHQLRGFIWLQQQAFDRALVVLRESLAFSVKYGNLLFFAECLELIGAIFAFKGSLEKAAKLFGKAKALRADLMVPPPPRNRPYVERAEEILRENLEEASLQQLLEEGKNLSMEAAERLASLS